MGHPADINAMNLLHTGRGATTAGRDSSGYNGGNDNIIVYRLNSVAVGQRRRGSE